MPSGPAPAVTRENTPSPGSPRRRRGKPCPLPSRERGFRRLLFLYGRGRPSGRVRVTPLPLRERSAVRPGEGASPRRGEQEKTESVPRVPRRPAAGVPSGRWDSASPVAYTPQPLRGKTQDCPQTVRPALPNPARRAGRNGRASNLLLAQSRSLTNSASNKLLALHVPGTASPDIRRARPWRPSGFPLLTCSPALLLRTGGGFCLRNVVFSCVRLGWTGFFLAGWNRWCDSVSACAERRELKGDRRRSLGRDSG